MATRGSTACGVLDPAVAQVIAPQLMDEVERLHVELARAQRQLAAE